MAGRLSGKSGTSKGWSATKQGGASDDLLYIPFCPTLPLMSYSAGVVGCLLSTCSG